MSGMLSTNIFVINIVLVVIHENISQVQCCHSKVLIFVPSFNCGVVELQGEKGEKANVFFTTQVSNRVLMQGTCWILKYYDEVVKVLPMIRIQITFQELAVYYISTTLISDNCDKLICRNSKLYFFITISN